MVLPLLAPLIGNLAASMFPALGTTIAGAFGAAGAAGPLVAAAAPKAIGAGIGSLLAGAPTAEAATNAIGFGSQALGMLGGGGAQQQAAPPPPPPPPVQRQSPMAQGSPQMPGMMSGGVGMDMAAPPGSMGAAPQPMQGAHLQGAQPGFSNIPSPLSGSGSGPMSGGLGSLPAMGGQPMPSVSQMIGSLGPNAPAAQQYLMGQRGFS
jgi:hypothetical protein